MVVAVVAGDRGVDHLDVLATDALSQVALEVMVDRLVVPDDAVSLLAVSGHRLQAVRRRSSHHEDPIYAVRLDTGGVRAAPESLTVMEHTVCIPVSGRQLNGLVIVELVAHQVLAVVAREDSEVDVSR